MLVEKFNEKEKEDDKNKFLGLISFVASHVLESTFAGIIVSW